ncbi:MAG: hypothetical protein KM310_01130 [Clostridiales bacterium]|nr:hypothetical protein [Clostridiales bacterium]
MESLQDRLKALLERSGKPLEEGWPRELLEATQAFYEGLRLEVEGEEALAQPEELSALEDDPLEEEGLSLEAFLERMEVLQAYRPVAEALARYQEEAQKKYRRGKAWRSDLPPEEPPLPSLEDLLSAFKEVWQRARARVRRLEKETLPLEKAMAQLEETLSQGPLPFQELFPKGAPRRQVIVLFLALLELIRLGRVKAGGQPLVVSLA